MVMCPKIIFFNKYLLTIHYGPNTVPYTGTKTMNRTKFCDGNKCYEEKIEQVRFRTRPSNHGFTMC